MARLYKTGCSFDKYEKTLRFTINNNDYLNRDIENFVYFKIEKENGEMIGDTLSISETKKLIHTLNECLDFHAEQEKLYNDNAKEMTTEELITFAEAILQKKIKVVDKK